MTSRSKAEEARAGRQSAPRPGMGRDVLMLFATQFATLALAVVSGIVVARVLGPEGKGALAILMLFASICSLVGSAGMANANVFFRGREKVAREAILGNTIVVSVAAGLLVTMVCPVARPLLERTTSGIATGPLVAVAAASVPIGVFGTGTEGMLLGDNRIAVVCAVRIIGAIARLVLLLVLLLRFGRTVFNALAAVVGGATASALVALYYLRSLGCGRPQWNATSLRASLVYGAKAQAGNLMQLTNYRIDHFFVGYWLPVRQVGIYSVATSIAELIWQLPSAVATALFPRVAREGDEAANLTTPRVFRVVAILTVAQAIALALVARPLIGLIFGRDFAPAAMPLLILLPGVILLSLSKTLSADLCGRGFPHLGVLASLLGLVATVGLDIALIPRIGIIGAAIASSISYSLSTAVIVHFFVRKSGSAMAALVRFRRQESHEDLQAARRAIGW